MLYSFDLRYLRLNSPTQNHTASLNESKGPQLHVDYHRIFTGTITSMIQIPNTVNVDIFALLNFRALSSRRHIPMNIFSCKYQIILFVLSLLSYFLQTSNFRTFTTLRELHENMCCAKISTFKHQVTKSQSHHLFIVLNNYIS